MGVGWVLGGGGGGGCGVGVCVCVCGGGGGCYEWNHCFAFPYYKFRKIAVEWIARQGGLYYTKAIHLALMCWNYQALPIKSMFFCNTSSAFLIFQRHTICQIHHSHNIFDTC